MKKKPTKATPRKTKAKPKALLSRQWQSESTLSARAADAPAQEDNSPTVTGGGGGNYKLSLSVSPEIMCCGPGKTITATASISGKPSPEKQDVTVTTPDGSKSGKGSVSMTYDVKESDCGTDVGFSGDGAGEHKEAKVPVIKITINMNNPHRVGITVGNNDRTQHLSASIAPARFGPQASVTAGPLLSLTNVKPAEGTVTFDLVGQKPGSTTQGDTFVKVKVGTCEVENKVSVIKPKATSKPHQQGQFKPIQSQRQLLDASSSPPAPFPVPPGSVALALTAMAQTTVGVIDQFGFGCGDLYAGSIITEDGTAINKTLQANSTYTDPVGATRFAMQNGQPVVVPTNSPQAQQWIGLAPQPLTDSGWTDAAPGVEVDGFELAPGLEGRKFRTIAPDIIEISWPD